MGFTPQLYYVYRLRLGYSWYVLLSKYIEAFLSVEHIMRDIPFGWFIRYLHANGASFFFIVVYMHFFRALFYGSFMYPRRLLWCSGVIILLLMIITSFQDMCYMGTNVLLGSYVITNLALLYLFWTKNRILVMERLFRR